MTTRREFISSSAALLGTEAIASPIKSLIGASETGRIQKDIVIPTPNDYVQNGLVCMYDGEWNIDIGQHENASKIWYDLCNKRQISLINDAVFEEKCLNTTTTKPWSSKRSGFPAFITFEACGFFDSIDTSLGASHVPPLFLVNGNRGLFFWGTNNTIQYSTYTSTAYGGHGHGQLWDSYPKFHTIGGYNEDNISTTYSDGYAKKTSFNRQGPAQNAEYFQGGGYYGDGIKAKIYNLRFYNRKLSENEIMQNYRIDKARFGL